MNFEKYLTMLRWEADIGSRIIRVGDLTDHAVTCYDIILIPSEMDKEDGVSYRIVTDIEEIKERMELWPALFAVLGSWTISDLVKGAMYMEDTTADYFESEV